MLPPIFDGHVHLIGEDADEYLAALLRTMDRNGVERAVVFGVQGDPECSDSLALRAHDDYPDRFVPFTCDVKPNAADLAERLDRRLRDGPWRGVGEIYLATREVRTTYRTRGGREMRYQYPVPSNGPFCSRFSEFFEVCANHHVPVLVHCDDEAVLQTLLDRHPETTFVWGHADCSADTPHLPLAHTNLLCEIGAGLHWGALDDPDSPYMDEWVARWAPLLERYPGQMVFGSDFFEWRHLEADASADCAYRPVRAVCKRLSAEAAGRWLSGALDRALSLQET